MSRINIRTDRLTRCEGHGKLVLRSRRTADRLKSPGRSRRSPSLLRGDAKGQAVARRARACLPCLRHVLRLRTLSPLCAQQEAAFGHRALGAASCWLRKLLYAGEMLESQPCIHICLLAGPRLFRDRQRLPPFFLKETRAR